jgi:hypothetical protein
MIYFKGEVARDIKPSPLGPAIGDITGYTVTINFQRPAGTTITKTGAIVDAATGQVKYTTTASDTVLDTVGEWLMQVKVNLSTTNVYYGPVENFYVEERIL